MPGLRQRPQHAQPMRPTAAAAMQHNHRGLVQMTGCRCGRPVVGGKHPARMGKSYALRLGLPVRDMLREKGTPYAELDLGNPKWTEDELLDFMAQHPILLQRPVVVTPTQALICRPAERVQEVLG